MESNALKEISGAWVDTSQAEFMKFAVKAEYDLSIVTPRTKSAVIKGLRTGVLGSTNGMAASVFTVVSKTFGLKYVCASEAGTRIYTNFNNSTFREAVIAIISLNSAQKDAGRFVHERSSGLYSWAWRGGVVLLRQVFADTIGVEDKKLREKAIDFLSAGGKFTGSWVDRCPR